MCGKIDPAHAVSSGHLLGVQGDKKKKDYQRLKKRKALYKNVKNQAQIFYHGYYLQCINNENTDGQGPDYNMNKSNTWVRGL